MSDHILVVEDELEVANSLCNFLKHSGFSVSHIDNGGEVEAFCKANKVDLVVLDVMLPVLTGFDVCQKLRANSDIPIFMLTACTDESQRLEGLELGADDYICKPFSAPELVLRIKNFLQRFHKAQVEDNINLKMDEFVVTYRGQRIELTKSEMELFHLLKKHPNKAFSRDRILDHIYQDYRVVSDRTVDTHIKNLRKKLKTISPEHDFVQAVYGVGYRFVAEKL